MWWIVFVLLPLNVQSLLCPVYNILNNETNFIDTCNEKSSLCSYAFSPTSHRRCLGIYTFESRLQTQRSFIRIRQLAFVDDFEGKYINASECILDVDKTGNNLLCRCNTDNCTLKWRRAEDLTARFDQKQTIFYEKFHQQEKVSTWFAPLTILLVVVIIIVVSMVSFLILVKYHADAQRNEKNLSSISTNLSNIEIDEFLSSNSTYQSIVSHGKSSTIYRAWTTEKEHLHEAKKLVGVKLYHEQSYKHMFENELQILRMLDHSTIINFINYGWHGSSPYLILEYHELGSLNNYLHSHKLPWSTCYSFLLSLTEAIDYLHYEELSPNDYLTSNRIRKPIILHRDIKSCNILIKSRPKLSLCLIDFGLAKVLPSLLTPNDFIQVGTYRYMSPELLELAITHTSDALCKVDMYALGLVLWEILTQCEDYPCLMDYRLPYAEYLNMNETNENRILETLHRVVVNDRKRPVLHRTTDMNSKISDVLTIIEDCWKHEPESRINARPALYRLRRLE